MSRQRPQQGPLFGQAGNSARVLLGEQLLQENSVAVAAGEVPAAPQHHRQLKDQSTEQMLLCGQRHHHQIRSERQQAGEPRLVLQLQLRNLLRQLLSVRQLNDRAGPGPRRAVAHPMPGQQRQPARVAAQHHAPREPIRRDDRVEQCRGNVSGVAGTQHSFG